MDARHAASAPYYIFYTTIKDSHETHSQPYSITFQDILDPSLGKLECSLQINYMVDIRWLMEQYRIARYSKKKLTIIHGFNNNKTLMKVSADHPYIDAYLVPDISSHGTHNSKMMLLCYEDGSMRIVVFTANLISVDWENRTQGIWISPKCPKLPKTSTIDDGDSETKFKSSLRDYLTYYKSPLINEYIKWVETCDFSHINVFLVASIKGTHQDTKWGLRRVGSLLSEYCTECPQAPLVAQTSGIGALGKKESWLTGDILKNFTKYKGMPEVTNIQPELKIIYPSSQNVDISYTGPLGANDIFYDEVKHNEQQWFNDILYQWQAEHSARTRALPHMRSYIRAHEDKAAYFLLTSANLTKIAWGTVTKLNRLYIRNFEAGVLFLPKFVINKDFFPLRAGSQDRLIVPYDLPPVPYTKGMTPWFNNNHRDLTLEKLERERAREETLRGQLTSSNSFLSSVRQGSSAEDKSKTEQGSKDQKRKQREGSYSLRSCEEHRKRRKVNKKNQ